MLYRLSLILAVSLAAGPVCAELQVNDSGTWKTPTEIHVNDSGTWKQVQECWINDSGTWEQAYAVASGSCTETISQTSEDSIAYLYNTKDTVGESYEATGTEFCGIKISFYNGYGTHECRARWSEDLDFTTGYEESSQVYTGVTQGDYLFTWSTHPTTAIGTTYYVAIRCNGSSWGNRTEIHKEQDGMSYEDGSYLSGDDWSLTVNAGDDDLEFTILEQ